jgi:hypothetical protein
MKQQTPSWLSAIGEDKRAPVHLPPAWSAEVGAITWVGSFLLLGM